MEFWFLVEFDGQRGALCAVSKTSLEDVRRQLRTGQVIEVDVAYDYFSPLRPIPIGTDANGQPVMGIGRESIVTGNHFMVEPCRSYINPEQVSKFTFLADMTEFDRETYMKHINNARQALSEQRRAQSPLNFPDSPEGSTSADFLVNRRRQR